MPRWLSRYVLRCLYFSVRTNYQSKRNVYRPNDFTRSRAEYRFRRTINFAAALGARLPEVTLVAHLQEKEEEVLMLCFRKILFPVDFSSRCIDTSPFVAAIARKFESEVVLLLSLIHISEPTRRTP